MKDLRKVLAIRSPLTSSGRRREMTLLQLLREGDGFIVLMGPLLRIGRVSVAGGVLEVPTST
jgi:hypothetical protein